MSLPSGLVERRAEFVSFSSSPTHPHTQLQPAVGPQLLGSSARKYNGRVVSSASLCEDAPPRNVARKTCSRTAVTSLRQEVAISFALNAVCSPSVRKCERCRQLR